MKSTGRYLKLPAVRRVINDSLFASKQLDLVVGQKTLALAPLLAARKAIPAPRPSLFAMILKAYAIVAAKRPELRRVFVTRPWRRLYEYDHNVFSVVVEKEYQGEKGLFLVRLDRPETMSLLDIDAKLRRKSAVPAAESKSDRNALRIASMPWPLRKLFWSVVMNWSPALRLRCLGTMGFSVTAAAGAAAITLLTPWTKTIYYDAPDEDGIVLLRSTLDHRVFDGKFAAIVGREVERELLTTILAEVKPSIKLAA